VAGPTAIPTPNLKGSPVKSLTAEATKNRIALPGNPAVFIFG